MKKTLNISLSVLLALGLAGCSTSTSSAASSAASSSTSSSASSTVAERFDYDPDTTMEEYIQIAVLSGTWYEMGVQLGTQYKDNVIAAAVYNIADQVASWGSYEAAVEAYQPYLEAADQWFTNEEDGSLRDMIQGVADSTGMTFNDAMMLFISAEVEDTEDEKDCSALIVWGDATSTEEPGAIGGMKADIGYGDLNYMPTLVMTPNHGYTFVSTHGVFGSVVNEAGLMIESPGGSCIDPEEVYAVGLFPAMYLGAYCATVEEAIDVLGDPETDDELWPINTDFNINLADATGDVVDYEACGTARSIRRNGDTHYIGETSLGDITTDAETSDYIAATNMYFSENMLFTSKMNPSIDLEDMWPDTIVRYWTLEKYAQDAAENGGADADTIREALSSSKYYIKEGWVFDCYPDLGYYGTMVPEEIMKGFEDGTISREDYYASYSEEWGEPMSMADVLASDEFSQGWHDNTDENAWTWNLDTSYWSPEPFTPDDKTAFINIFDSNTKDLYLLRGSADRAISNIPGSAGVFTKLSLDTETTADWYNGDKIRGMCENLSMEMEVQLWSTARSLSNNDVDADTADGAVLYGYYDTAREAYYQAQNYANLGFLSEDTAEANAYYAQSLSLYMKAQMYAKLAQEDPQTLAVDYGTEAPSTAE